MGIGTPRGISPRCGTLPPGSSSGAQRELEAIAGYSKAIEDLEVRMRKDRVSHSAEQDESGEAAAGSAWRPKQKAKGGGKGAKGE